MWSATLLPHAANTRSTARSGLVKGQKSRGISTWRRRSVLAPPPANTARHYDVTEWKAGRVDYIRQRIMIHDRVSGCKTVFYPRYIIVHLEAR